MFLHLISPGTLRGYASCLEYRRDLGEDPEPEFVAEIARREGGNWTAMLVLARWKLLDAEGRVVPLNGIPNCNPAAVVPDAETAWAILSTGRRPSVRLVSPRGRDIPERGLAYWADRQRR